MKLVLKIDVIMSQLLRSPTPKALTIPSTLQNQTNLYKPEIYHVSMKVIHAEIKNGIIYPKEKLDIDDRDVLIRIEDLHEIKLEAREDIIETIAELDIEEMI